MASILAQAKKILIVNTFGIGDVLFTTPLISNIKRQYPHISIGYVCNRRTVEILEKNNDVDKVFVYERDEFDAVNKQSKISYFKKIKQFMDEIKNEQFDIVIDVSLNTMTSFLTWVSGIKMRIGLNYKNRSRFLSNKINIKGYEGKHVVDYYLNILQELGVKADDKQLKLVSDEDDMKYADQFIKDLGIKSKKKLIGIVPGGGASWGKDAHIKLWPLEKYAELADKLIEIYDANIILLGDEKERDSCEKMAEMMGNRPFLACSNTNFGRFASLVKKCAFVVLNDGGPLHMAVAAGVRTVSIFGPVDENVYGPYPKDNHVVITKSIACRPCYYRFRRSNCDHISCLRNLDVHEVLDKIKRTTNERTIY